MIDLCIIHSKVYVWHEEAATALRQEHRIVGCMLGCLPRKAFQNAVRTLPLQLMPEEVTLIIDKGIGRVLHYPRLQRPANIEEQKKFENQRKKLYDDQVQIGIEERKRQILANTDKIVSGKGVRNKRRKKRQSPTEELTKEPEELPDVIPLTDPKDLVREAIAKITPISESTSMVQIFTACPWLCDEGEAVTWTFPATEHEKRRYQIFKDLWEKGFFLSSGRKFGADFLVYSGDPYVHHASYVATVLPPTKPLSAMDLVAKGRLANSVRKASLLCSVNENDEIIYTSLHWSRIK